MYICDSCLKNRFHNRPSVVKVLDTCEFCCKGKCCSEFPSPSVLASKLETVTITRLVNYLGHDVPTTKFVETAFTLSAANLATTRFKLVPPLRTLHPAIPQGGYIRGTPAQMAMCAGGKHERGTIGSRVNWCKYCCASLHNQKD